MRKERRFGVRRARIVVGTSVLTVALAAAGVLVGVGFATAAPPLEGKYTICHVTGSKKHASQTITISPNAWPAHERHGDTLGECVTTTIATTTTTTAAPQTSAPGKSGEQHGNSGNSQGKGHNK
jgi:hypothetical protein